MTVVLILVFGYQQLFAWLRGRGALLLCVVEQSSDMTVLTVWHSATSTVANVEIRETCGYLRSIIGQINNLKVCLGKIRYQRCGF